MVIEMLTSEETIVQIEILQEVKNAGQFNSKCSA